MSNKLKLALILAGLYLLLVVLFGAVGAALWADMDPQEREATLAILENRYGLAVFVILACWVIIGFIVHALYRAYVLAPSEAARAGPGYGERQSGTAPASDGGAGDQGPCGGGECAGRAAGVPAARRGGESP